MQTPVRRPFPVRPESAFKRPLPRTAPRFLRFIPRSTAINFLALILLGALVFALQSFGRKGDPAAQAQPTATPAPVAVAAAPEVKLETVRAPAATAQPAAAPAAAAAPAVMAPTTMPATAPVMAPTTPAPQAATTALPPMTLPAPTTAPAVEPPSADQVAAAQAAATAHVATAAPAAPAAAPATAPAVYTLKNPAPEATAEKPSVDTSRTAAAKQRAKLIQGDRFAADRSIAIEDLDGEGARQAYLRQTSGMPSASAPRDQLSTSSQPASRRAPADDLAMEGNSYRHTAVPPPSELKRSSRNIEDDLDGEVARLNYLKQNNSAPGNATASERKGAAVPTDGGSPRSFIPYEQ